MYRLLVGALLACCPLLAQSKLLPVDESSTDPQFSKFYQAFRSAVAKKDAKFLVSTLNAGVQSEIDGEPGPKAFEKRWNPADPASKLWKELETVIALGGSFSTEQGIKTFCAPYTYSKFPDALDSFDHGVIIGPKVELRSKLDKTSPMIASLSYEIVKVPSWDPRESSEWIRVKARAGSGYVRRSEIRSPSDFRACFTRQTGQWTLRWLVAGD